MTPDTGAAGRGALARGIAVASFWAFVALLYSGNLWWLSTRPGERINLRAALIWQAGYYLTWIPYTLIVWRVSREWLPETLGWGRFLLRHAALFAAVVVAHTLTVILIGRTLTSEQEPWLTMFAVQLRGRLHMQTLVYVAVAGMGHALGLYERYRERQMAAARLEADLASARLDALRAQLQPHFLFNSLHGIASLARGGDNAGVVRLIAGFSDLLRNVLDTRIRRQPLAEEVRLVRQYLDIQQVRFGDRLASAVHLSDDAASARVPPLIVQPLVENALRHGVGPRIVPGHIVVRARRDGAWTIIDVEDDGVGLPSGWTPGSSDGTGLRNLASRLEAEFGDRASVSLAPRDGGGTRATVRLPFAQA